MRARDKKCETFLQAKIFSYTEYKSVGWGGVGWGVAVWGVGVGVGGGGVT